MIAGVSFKSRYGIMLIFDMDRIHPLRTINLTFSK